MIHIKIQKVEWSGIACANPNCLHLPEYTDHIIGNNWFLKQDTTCAMVFCNHSDIEYYCRDCIDKLYNLIKIELNSKLWIFR